MEKNITSNNQNYAWPSVDSCLDYKYIKITMNTHGIVKTLFLRLFEKVYLQVSKILKQNNNTSAE